MLLIENMMQTERPGMGAANAAIACETTTNLKSASV
jgi:hypothetical protein